METQVQYDEQETLRLKAMMASGLRWRLNLVQLKVTGQLPQIPWDQVVRETLRRREWAWEVPTINVLEEEDEQGMMRYEIAGREHFAPKAMTPGILEGCYKLVYWPENYHNFEYEGCRVKSGMVVMDCGAAEGFFTRYALEKGCSVIAVEPWFEAAAALRRTYAKEIAEGRMVVVEACLLDKPGKAQFQVVPNYPIASSLSLPPNTHQYVNVDVEVTTMDDVVRNSPFGRCDFVKMDIEGSERPAIAGAHWMLKTFKPCLGLAIYHEVMGYVHVSNDLQALNLGYRMHANGLEWGFDRQWRPVILHGWVP